jgi:septum formation protein
MLEAAGVPFVVADAPLDEEEAKQGLANLAAAPLAEALAEAKASSVAVPGCVLGCDQTLELESGATFSKPGSRAEAFDQLRMLSGRSHRLHSAAAIVEGGRLVWRATESAELRMRPLSDAFIDDYLGKEYDAIRWSVGGYRIEGLGAQLFERIDGSHFAILGLPLLPLLAWLRGHGMLLS